MDSLTSFLNIFVTIIKNVATWILNGIAQVLIEVLYLAFDAVLTIVNTVIQGLDFTGLALNYSAYWGLLPPQLIWMINEIGLSAGMSMLGTAYIIRLTLNLIPSEFTRV